MLSLSELVKDSEEQEAKGKEKVRKHYDDATEEILMETVDEQ